KACVLPENPASYRVVRTKSYLFNKASSSFNSPSKDGRVVQWILDEHMANRNGKITLFKYVIV
ncbi:hypothetical protein, partial [Klebsiella pneumoniae]